MGKAVLPVRLALLKEMFMLPGDFEIVSSAPDPWHKSVNLLIESPEIPDVAEGEPFCRASLHVTQEQHSGDPEYRKVTVVPEIEGVQ